MDSYHNFSLRRGAVSIVFASILCLFAGKTAFASEQVNIVKSPLTRLIQQPIVTAIHRDSKGLLWIGTQQGLYMFDGAQLTPFNAEQTNESKIPVSNITGIGEISHDGLLIATFGGGLLKWNKLSMLFEPVEHAELSNEKFLTHLLVSQAGRVWLGTNNKLLLYEPDAARSSSWFSDNNLANAIGQPVALTEDNEGNIFVASNTDLYKISEHQRSIEKVYFDNIDLLKDMRITALEVDSGGHLFLGTNTGKVISLDPTTGLVISQEVFDINASSSISDLLVLNKELWVGTNNGLTLADTNLALIDQYHENNSQLSNNHITILHKDDRQVWIGTYQGLNLLSFVPFSTFDQKNSHVFNDVLAFEQDNDGRIWVGTYNGLYLLDPENGSHTKIGAISGSPPIIDQRIMTIAAKGDVIWLGFRQGGVQIIDIESGAHSIPNIPNINELEITKILHFTSGETWIGTYNQGLFRIKEHQVDSFAESNLLPESRITQLFQLQSDELLIVAQNRVYSYSSRYARFSPIEFRFEGSTTPPLILSINESESGDLWLGTKDQGLYVWPKFIRENGKTDLQKVRLNRPTTIYGIEFDAAGNVWCSTQDGLLKLDSNRALLAKFTLADGLQGNDFNLDASFRDSDGNIYFGGSNGYNRFAPKDIRINLDRPKLLLTNIGLSGSMKIAPLSPSEIQTLQLTHKDYFVVFTFSVLDFLDPEKNQFRYKLENFDPEWIENGTRNTATYTNLPPGEYVFRVQGANSAGVWNREGISLFVRVLPPPWLTWWAYCLYGVAALFFLWIFKRVYDSYVIKKRATQMAIEMHETVNRADDDMQEQLESQDDLVKSAYQHNVATLALVSDYISRQGDYLADDAAREATESSIKGVAALANLEECLYYQDGGLLADLHKYTDILISKLVHNASVRPDTIASINEVSTKLITAEIASPLSIALYELLENCFQHAFELESPANYIHVSLDVEPTDSPPECSYRLTVQDNGVGCPGNIHLDTPETSGFATVHAIAHKLSGSLHISSDNGTTVTLVFAEVVPV